ncbi:LemA family protein [Candidatus Electronema sp. PJ]|uniref:LemA family protein n=1 Tax=Candidatus Electronema sp. PJ TaxID=3401572 RepID=UPI003AA8CD79
MVGYLILGTVALLIALFISMYNRFIALRNKVDEAFATLYAHYKKRCDLLPNFVEIVKGYAAQEQQTLNAAIEAYKRSSGAESIPEMKTGETAFLAGIRSLLALSENSPALKADEKFQELQQQLEVVEKDVSQARKYYNELVHDLNTRLKVFPQSIVGAMLGISKREYFEVSPEERKNIKFYF